MRWFGIETEYGIVVDGANAADLVEISRAVVQAYQGIYAAPWNYEVENPRRDMRGFDQKALARDPRDAQFDRPASQSISNREEHADHMLPNGARLYNDHGHPEYATPECADILDLVAHDKAGERIVLECAQQWARTNGKRVQIIKNNGDYHGASYGCHESYAMNRAVDWESALPMIAAFLATRIIFTGAGKVGSEKDYKSTFQLSQRADFIDVLQSVDTLYRRPLVNTRDEPHADARQLRRLHVISGDANMSEYATALKVGTARALVQLLESGWRLPFSLRDPVLAIAQISRDESYQWLVETNDYQKISALDVQDIFLDAATNLRENDAWIINEWCAILRDLRDDPLSCHDRLDWAAKKVLLDDFAAAENLDWNGDREFLQSLDIAYADLDFDNGLYYGLQETGQMRTLVSNQQIENAMKKPPANTRAALRGLLIEKFHSAITSISWNTVEWQSAGSAWNLRLKSTFDPQLLTHLAATKTLDEVAQILRSI